MADVEVVRRFRQAYEARWRNTEAITVRDGRVSEVEVYFGGAI